MIRTVLTLLVLTLATPAFAQRTPVTFNGRPAEPEEILIRLRGNDSGVMTRARAAAPFASIEPLSPGLALHLVRAPGNSLASLLQAFSNHPDVLYAEPNYIVKATTVPNDPFFASLWGMTKIDAPTAWDISTGGNSFVVGVVDSGVAYTHPDLAANIWSAPAAFTVTIQGNSVHCPAGSHGFNALVFSCDPLDDYDHGTHTSGTLGATGNNALGVAGVNWATKIMGLKFLNAGGTGPVSAAINAIEFAIQAKLSFAGTATPVNVRVLSNSWGGGGFSQGLLDEINKANSNEMLFVASAGNEASDNDITFSYPANYSTVAPNVIAVAATDFADGLASFSNYGAARVQLGAPGVGITSTVRNGYLSASGTSMATPHVAGAAMLTLAACPSLTTSDLKNAILANVDPVPGLAGKTSTGGRLNVNRTIRSCAVSSTLSATFLGIRGEDRVGQNGVLAPNGIPDWQIHVQGLRGTPARVRITSASGIWEAPFNGVNWVVATQYGTGGTGDFWFEPWGSVGFHVKVFYADGTADETDAVGSIPSGLTASFLGVTGQDRVGQNGALAPNGIPDWQIHVQGLAGTPARVRITSASGIWEAPFNGVNWVVATQYGTGGTGDFWFEPWGSASFHVKVFYNNGTTDEVDVTNPSTPSTLAASFLGITGEDRVGQNGLSGPNGIPDWQIRLLGLRDTPIAVRITSLQGIWAVPFNGANWLVAAEYGAGGTGNLWFEPWGSPGFHVKVWYSDGTTDEVDAL